MFSLLFMVLSMEKEGTIKKTTDGGGGAMMMKCLSKFTTENLH